MAESESSDITVFLDEVGYIQIIAVNVSVVA